MALKKHASPEPLREVLDRQWPRDTPGLLQQLRQGSGEQRRWAARDLAQHPAAAQGLGEALLHEPDPTVREALFTSLSRIADPTAANALLPLLRSEDAALRNGAIEALADMPAAVAPRVQALLHDSDPDVRIFTVNLLGELRHPDVPRWLAEVLRHEHEVNVVAAALEVMAEVGQPEHAELLQHTARRFADDPFIAFAAQTAAERIGTP
jgi:HEAT repeat protein